MAPYVASMSSAIRSAIPQGSSREMLSDELCYAPPEFPYPPLVGGRREDTWVPGVLYCHSQQETLSHFGEGSGQFGLGCG